MYLLKGITTFTFNRKMFGIKTIIYTIAHLINQIFHKKDEVKPYEESKRNTKLADLAERYINQSNMMRDAHVFPNPDGKKYSSQAMTTYFVDLIASLEDDLAIMKRFNDELATLDVVWPVTHADDPDHIDNTTNTTFTVIRQDDDDVIIS